MRIEREERGKKMKDDERGKKERERGRVFGWIKIVGRELNEEREREKRKKREREKEQFGFLQNTMH